MMTDEYGLLLTGRPVSRTTNRYYDPSPQNVSSRHPKDWENEDYGDDYDQSFVSEGMVTGYDTLNDTKALNSRVAKTQQNYAVHHEMSHGGQQEERGYTPRQTMSKTRNKYRLKKHKPTECDDALFGKPVQQDYKEWKAPWDQSKTTKPLTYDSTDRAGHYSPEKPNVHRPIKSANQRRAWR